MPWRRGKKRRKKNQMESLIPGLFQPAFRDLWEFRSLTPHAFFEPKGSYDRCTVLTRKRWMLSEEKRIGLSSQKMRERGEKGKKVCGIASPLYMSLCVLFYTQTQRIRKEKERERWIMMCHISLFHSWDDFQRGMCIFFWHRVTYVWSYRYLSHTQTHSL